VDDPTASAMSTLGLILLGLAAGTGAGLLAGLIGIGGGIVVVPVIYYGLAGAGATTDQAAHIAVATSLAAIMPAAVVSSLAHWRAGNTDFAFLREWGPGIVIGVIAAQFATPHLHGNVVTGLFALFCLGVSIRFAAPNRFRPIRGEPPNGGFCHAAGVTIGLVSGFAGVGGGILTNIFMTLCGLPGSWSASPRPLPPSSLIRERTTAASIGRFGPALRQPKRRRPGSAPNSPNASAGTS
jgi:uncharacterized membrane protein YfcA